MAQAYDFALDKMGMDIASFPLWNDYVKFLKGVDAVGSYAENQKITAIRKVYQRAIVNPMINIEQLWYDDDDADDVDDDNLMITSFKEFLTTKANNIYPRFVLEFE